MSKSDKDSPSSLDLDYYENIILFNSLLSQEYLASIVEYVDLSYFNDKNIKIIFKSILNFFQERGAVPSLTEIKSRLVLEEERKAFNEITIKLKQIDSKFNKDELLANTERFLKERCLYNSIVKTAEKFSQGKVDPSETLQEFEKAYAINLREDLGHWYLEEIDEHIKELSTIYKPIPTGWKFFDEKCEGGLFPKTLTVFAGQVNVGKSIVLGNLATNMLLVDRNVLLISLEMSEFMYSKRISSQISQIPHNDLKIYTSELKEQVEHIQKNLKSKLIIKEYAPKSVTVRHLDAYITKLSHKGFKPDIVVIDYINLILPTTKGQNSYTDIKEIAEQLRALSFKYNIPVVSATQIGRGAFNTSSPGMESVAESIGLPATCDVMLSIWQTDEDKELGVINMGMQKNRFGPNFGQSSFKCNYETLTLKEVNPDHFESEDPQNALNEASNALDKLTN
jgi:replicative DNA helicase